MQKTNRGNESLAGKAMITKKTSLGKILLVGTGEGAMSLIEECERFDLISSVVGFVDDDATKQGKNLRGVSVIGTLDDMGNLVQKHRVRTVIISIQSLPREKINLMIDSINPKKVHIKIIPANREQVVEEISLNSMRNLLPEELIGREGVELNTNLIEKRIKNKTILITGAGGSIGSEICYQLLGLPIKQMICLCRSEYSLYQLEERLESENKKKVRIQYYLGNIKDIERMEEIISTEKPNFIFHAAAHKHVPYMEKNEKEAIKNNVFGTENLLQLASKYRVERFVLISTDKAVNPINIMGATKRIAELLTHYYHQNHQLNAAVVRFGNVIGSRGSVIPLFSRQIKAGGPITVTHKQTERFFMTLREASLLVINAAVLFDEENTVLAASSIASTKTNGGATFMLDMGKPINIDSFVRRLVRLSGFEPDVDIDIVYTGLREGEKMQEELLTQSGNIAKTINKKIFIVNESRNHLHKICEWVQNMKSKTSLYNNKEVRKQIKQILKEY